MYEIFEQLLQENKVTAYKVAKETGISSSTLTDWKMGRSTPKQDKLQLIADFFGVSISYLMGIELEENRGYYLNNETKTILEELRVNPKLKILFDASKKLEPSDIEFVINMVERLKIGGNNR